MGLNYRQMLATLLPPGPAWDIESAPQTHKTLDALAIEFERVQSRINDLIDEMDPASVRELIPDWEIVMGLPDKCTGPEPTFEDRRRAVQQRLLSIGEQRPAYFIKIAQQCGYPNARIVEHRAPRFGRSRFGVARFGTRRQQFIWTVNLGKRRAAGRRFGLTVFGERFGENPDSAVECLIRRYAPAHTLVLFEHED